MVAHNVFFTLKDRSDPAKAKLVTACREHLKGHPGEVFFAAGVLAQDLKREVNVTDFDVALHIVFKTKEDQDRYQVAPRHQKFIEQNNANWEKVRVFDSYVE
ncbi:MAG: Dabb family protein [Acidobacteria bacterium]|nr:MAG: Dabb family protein [Acidobacteriota bacterium]